MKKLVLTFACCFTLTGLRTAVGQPGAQSNAETNNPASPAAYPAAAVRSARLDEAMSGRTLLGTPVSKRTFRCFPAESVDVFRQMDQVATLGKDGKRDLAPLKFDANGDGKISDLDRDAIRGRNTWLLWGGGNETFWGWLQERGYGLTDFLILMDSRQRTNRFRRAGLINQPGFRMSDKPGDRILGLYLDQPIPDKAELKPSPSDDGLQVGASRLKARKALTEGDKTCFNCHPHPGGRTPDETRHLFIPGDDAKDLYAKTRAQLELKDGRAKDGLDPEIYGYASGIFGLRLFLNPDFFGNTAAARRARAYWDERVVSDPDGKYYTNATIHADPKLVRPFRVSMSCGFCHVGPHPLNPPPDPEEPKWENLSSIIGDQFWAPQPAFANLLTTNNFLYHFLASQPPGTIDTSLVSTDHINNPNTINAIFDLPARLVRAMHNSLEPQSPENLLMGSVEDPKVDPKRDSPTGVRYSPNLPYSEGGVEYPESSLGNPKSDVRNIRAAPPDPRWWIFRHFPRVLLDGADSCGALVALLRVPINIGTYSEEWSQCHNPIIGFRPQKPLRVKACQANSVYWQANDQFRIPYLAAFFTFTNSEGQSSTAPMKLQDAKTQTKKDEEAKTIDLVRARAGRDVFLRNCAICHSSKQPDDFRIQFQRDMPDCWENAKRDSANGVYRLPMDFANWEPFKKSPAYNEYVAAITALANPAPTNKAETVQSAEYDASNDLFIQHNFLSSEVRIPITLVGSNSGRSAGTNGKRGQVWDNFSSEGYKSLPSVGAVRYYNPYSSELPDSYGNNDSYILDGGGPGYYRPASLISLWSTAPYLHNNTLGVYKPNVATATGTNNPASVEARLAAFDDGINKLLWNTKRAQRSKNPSAQPSPGELRTGLAKASSPAAARDLGFIYRLPQDTHIMMAAPFIRPLVEGVLGRSTTRLLNVLVPLALIVLFIVAAWQGQARHAGIAFLFLAAGLAAFLTITGLGTVGGAANLGIWLWWLAVFGLTAAGFVFFFVLYQSRGPARSVFIVLAASSLILGIIAHLFLDGVFGPLRVGPIPRGTPVNLLMNIDPAKKREAARAAVSLVRALVEIRRNGLTQEDAFRVFDREAGPALLRASKCPDFVLDRGHWFGEHLSDQEKTQLIEFLKTL